MDAEPSVNPISSAPKFLSVLKTAPSYMVNGKEFQMTLATTSAGHPAVGNEDLVLEFHSKILTLFRASRSVGSVVRCSLGFMCCLVHPVVFKPFHRIPSSGGLSIGNKSSPMRRPIGSVICASFLRVFVGHKKSASTNLPL